MKHKLPKNYNNLLPFERKEVREQYIEEQNDKCFYCNNKLTEQPPKEILELKLDMSLFPKGMLDSPIHLQHNHKTGMTEGAVHAYCNCVMWQYEGR